MKEKILNSFLSTNLQKLGLVHVNSEVPKKMGFKKRKRTDIIAYDIESKRPIIIELKAKRDHGVLFQLDEYLSDIPPKYPYLFEELNVFRYDDNIEFNYEYGIIGMVVSPEAPPENVDIIKNTILWAQYNIQDRKFKIVNNEVLNKAKESEIFFTTRDKYNPLEPEDFVDTNLINLRKYVRSLHNLFLSISTTVYPRFKYGNDYIAYWPTNGTRAIFGFNTGSSHSYIDVEFHIYVNNHPRFLDYDATKKLRNINLNLKKPKKGQIYPIRIDEDYASDDSMVFKSLELFKLMAILSYNFEILTEIDDYKIDDESINSLSLRSFGL